MALSFAIAVVAAIWIGAAVADNAFVQIFVTFLAAIALVAADPACGACGSHSRFGRPPPRSERSPAIR